MKKRIFQSLLLAVLLFAVLSLNAQSDDLLWKKNYPVASFAFSPTDSLLAVGVGGYGVVLFDIVSGDSVGRYPEMFGDGPLSLSYSRDGKLLAGCSYNGRIFLWNTETKQERIIDTPGVPLSQIEISPDGKLLAVAAREKGLLIYSVESGLKVEEWNDMPITDWKLNLKAEVAYISFKFDNSAIAIGSTSYNSIYIYDLITKE
jgi:WD40 repeat protein